METGVVKAEKYGVVNFEDYAMPIASVVRQVALIQEVMKGVMKDGEHYGVIPGTKKPSLLKPGAEKLCLTFRLDPAYDIIREIRDKEFIAYTVRCDLTHIPSGQKIASGIGSCNSREGKYRYRHIEKLTETPVPKEYWKAKSAGDSKEMKRLLGEGMRARKNEATGQWVLARSEQVDNDNPWDLDNTLIKMACKRALVAAVLNGTAASDIFTQDVEDLPPDMLGSKKEEPIDVTPKAEEKKEETQREQGTDADLEFSEKDIIAEKKKQISALMKGFSSESKKEFFHFVIDGKATVDNLQDFIDNYTEHKDAYLKSKEAA